jgi:hypothetical protein
MEPIDDSLELTEKQWKFEQLKRLYEIKHDLLGQPEAEHDTLVIAQKCGLLQEFKQYLSELA